MKAIEEGDVEASDLLADFLAEDSDQVTPAEAKTQILNVQAKTKPS